MEASEELFYDTRIPGFVDEKVHLMLKNKNASYN